MSKDKNMNFSVEEIEAFKEELLKYLTSLDSIELEGMVPAYDAKSTGKALKILADSLKSKKE